ncbi:MAG: metallophosphoesterase family protein [Haloferacaceae archaeon]
MSATADTPLEVALLGDTHVPSRAPAIPDWVAELLRAADHAVHAGDFDSRSAFERVRDLAGGADRLTAARGNVDPQVIGLPSVATVDLGGVTFVVTHGDGRSGGYRERVAGRVREHGGPDAVGVCGHTHEYLDTRVDGVRLLNPGTATGAAPADEASMMVATVADGAVDVTPHRR